VAASWAAEIDEEVLLTGNALAKYGDIFGDALGTRASVAAEYLWDPSGRAVLSVYAAARSRGEQGDGDPATVLPIYTRLSDAEEAERGRGLGVTD
jgi:N6-L-threonylcarbamoyladenine synthase